MLSFFTKFLNDAILKLNRFMANQTIFQTRPGNYQRNANAGVIMPFLFPAKTVVVKQIAMIRQEEDICIPHSSRLLKRLHNAAKLAVQMDYIRFARNLDLGLLDLPVKTALDNYIRTETPEARLAYLVLSDEQQRLRDIPQNMILDPNVTPMGLMAQWPENLPRRRIV